MRRLLGQLLVISTVSSLALLGIVLHGREAVVGISWGYERALSRLCTRVEVVCEALRSRVPVNLGVYDPGGDYARDWLAIEHFYVPWNSYDKADLMSKLKSAAQRKRWPLITVEPWPHEREGSHQLFEDITRGRYDRSARAICGNIQVFAQPVFVRWGHEMDLVTGRYPWAQEDADGYVDAYRHFVDLCRTIAHRIFYVWSPVGTKNLHRYWPGREYADYVGLSVYGFPQWDLAHYRKVRSFDEIFAEKYARIRDLHRPVMIAELGVTGNREHQLKWMHDAFKSFSKYPLLRSVVYFNAVDSPGVWPREFGVPDWRMDLRLMTVRFSTR